MNPTTRLSRKDYAKTLAFEKASQCENVNTHIFAARVIAVMHLLHDFALGHSEVAALDVADFDEASGTLNVSGDRLNLPAACLDAVRAWLRLRKGLLNATNAPWDADKDPKAMFICDVSCRRQTFEHLAADVLRSIRRAGVKTSAGSPVRRLGIADVMVALGRRPELRSHIAEVVSLAPCA